MKKICVKLLCSVFIIAAAMLFITSTVNASRLPWLYIDDDFMWNANTPTPTLYNTSETQVTSVKYVDGSIAKPSNPFPPIDSVLGKFTLSPLAFHNVMVDLSISLDGNNINDYLRLVADYDGTVWLNAMLDVSSVANPLANSPNPWRVMIKSAGLSGTMDPSSQWSTEFWPRIDTSKLHPAVFDISWSGSPIPQGSGIYKVHASGKVAPIPEPSTLLLLGSGLIGFSALRKKFMKK